VVLAFLWRKALRPSEARYFWVLLATAWTLNLFGNIAWIVHDIVTGTTLDTLSFIDFFYVSRYVMIGCALWLYPAPLSRRTWVWVAGIMLAVILMAGAVYSSPAMAFSAGRKLDFLGLSMYTTLDAGVITLAVSRVRAARSSAWDRYSLLLFFAMLSYGIANTLNLTKSLFPSMLGGTLMHVFWILSDVFFLWMALGADLPKENQSLMRNEV
jgi:hypothetical protein